MRQEKVELENLKYDVILYTLKDRNVKKILFEYSGENDDGAIDQIILIDNDDRTMHSNIIDDVPNLMNELEDHVYDILETVSDWVNNEGGYGEVCITTEDGKYRVSNNIRHISYSQEKYTGKLGSFTDYKSHKEYLYGKG